MRFATISTFGVAVIIFCSACNLLEISVDVPDSGPVVDVGGILFSDNFDHGLSDAWVMSPNANGAWTTREGRLTMNDDLAPDDIPLQIYAGNSNWRDYVVQMDVFTGGTCDYMAFLVRVKDPDNVVAFFPCRSFSSQLSVKRNGIWEHVKNGRDVPCCDNYHIDIAVEGDTFNVYVNGSPVLSANIEGFSSGYIGFQMADEWGNARSVDELVVKAR